MDWLSFIASVLASVAWPAAMLCVVLLLRKELVARLPFLRKLKAGPVEAEFEREVKNSRMKRQQPYFRRRNPGPLRERLIFYGSPKSVIERPFWRLGRALTSQHAGQRDVLPARLLLTRLRRWEP
jgi:hypothetical protein